MSSKVGSVTEHFAVDITATVGDVIRWVADIYVECGDRAHFICTAPVDHTGPHIAQDGADEVVAVWAQR